jgi:DNA-binding NarL/FixJ family response regulator
LSGTVIRVLVVDDHPVVLDGVTLALQSTALMEVAGYARSGKEAIDVLELLRPDVVLLDLRLPDMLGPEVVRSMLARTRDTRIILFTAYPDHASREEALAVGAHGIMVKDSDRGDLIDVIRRVMDGERVVADGLPDTHVSEARYRVHGLTRREYEILRRIAMGETNPQIADALGLTRNTVKTYVQRTLEKLGARNRIEALIRANQTGIL